MTKSIVPEVESGDELVLLRQWCSLLAIRALQPGVRQLRLLRHVRRSGLPVCWLLLALTAAPHTASLPLAPRL